MDIYTIGHSNYTMEKLIQMLRYYNINTVVDIRGTPYSKYNVQFDKERIKIDKFIYSSKCLLVALNSSLFLLFVIIR